MKRRIRPDIGREELAAVVSDSLREHGVDAVLVGGSVVAIYTKERYVTDDLDFVSYKPLKVIAPVMEALGFEMTGNTAFHSETKLYVQFCAPPISVGREPVETVQLTTKHGTLETLSPTDCVLDRLMQFFHWNDRQALEQALLVSTSQKVNLRRIREVSLREHKLDAFDEFRALLGAAKGSSRR
jgi:hypothetical protein